MTTITRGLWAALDAAADNKSAWLRGRTVFIDTYRDPSNHRSIPNALSAAMEEASEGDHDRFKAGMDTFWRTRGIPSFISLKLIWGVVGLIVGLVLAVILHDTSLLKGIAPVVALIGLVVGVAFAFTFIGDYAERRAVTDIETQ